MRTDALRVKYFRTFGLVFVATSVGACGGSSPYDETWIRGELSRRTGHEVAANDSRASDARRTELPRGVSSPFALSEDDAVAIALWNSPQLRADLAQIGFAHADLADAAALPNPNLAFLFPVGTRQLELSAQYPLAVLVQRPWRVASAKLDVERSARALVQSGLDTIRDVRIAWAELEACGRRRTLRARTMELIAKSATLSATRFSSGEVSALEADLVKAEAYAASDLSQRAVREESLARIRLRMLVGLGSSPLGATIAARPTEIMQRPLPALPELEKVALASRPDLRAAELAIDAAGERSGLEKAKLVQLVARLDAKPVGSGGGAPLLWIPGASAEIPLFSQNPGGRARVATELERAAWLYLATRDQVLTDVRLAREELELAHASRAPWKDAIVPLQERNVLAATRAYEAGGESYLVVLEATRKLVEAHLRVLDLQLDVRRAEARLDRAVGWRIRVQN